ncbi:activating signal cointegrator 1-like [Ruditapes philippinarum]|uniref:activating signal cointegrator 1-like n=1 Tax=Ruditapes philippinarum TaxID=129788 RepID=UPI00295B0897|nr:activating signal cointegrator 1-like [Ruditapes philippinarum]
MADKIENWTCEELGKLGIDASIEIARYILSIETAEELEEYMLELLDGSNLQNKKFIKELLVKWRPYHSAKTDTNVQVYKKSDQDDKYITGKEKKKSQNLPKEKKNTQKNYVLNGYEVQHRGILPGEEPPEQPLPVPTKPVQKDKDVKKKKFVPLFSKEGQALSVVQLAGRHICECQAAKHKLINNCTRCGRVVCDQEGSGPCLFCGNLVCTREEEEILSRGSKKSEKLRQFLMKDNPSGLLGGGSMFNGDRDYLPSDRGKMKESYIKAEQHKEKLLEYDRTSVRRTQVIDDEADYFSTDSNQWLTKDDREMLRKREEELRSQRHGSRKDRKITLDFAGRQVIEEDTSKSVNMYDVNDDVVQRVNFGARPKEKTIVNKSVTVETDDYLVNPTIQVEAPKFVPQNPVKHSGSTSKTKEPAGHVMSRIQDRELQEMSDEGMCMSMHQPWASLLVVGIKLHEGRTWYTSHRGRLWIAATAKSPDPAEIANVEQMYKTVYKGKDLQFPSHYPVGCLLGCVDVVDCLSQDTYQEQFPEGESGSPFVFICENPCELVVKFPVKGKHKIYKLDSHIHKAAKKGLR